VILANFLQKKREKNFINEKNIVKKNYKEIKQKYFRDRKKEKFEKK